MDHTATHRFVTASRLTSKGGFTLIELMVVVVLLVTMMLLAIPSIDGLFQEQALQARLDDAHRLVQRARWQAIEQRAPVRLMLDEKSLRISAPLNAEEASEAASLQFGAGQFPLNEGDKLSLEKPFAPQPSDSSWTFWPSGNCEPVILRYQGPEGSWTVRYDPLSAEYQLLSFEL